MPVYRCFCLTTDHRIIAGAHIEAKDLNAAINAAHRRWRAVSGFDSVEVWLGPSRLSSVRTWAAPTAGDDSHDRRRDLDPPDTIRTAGDQPEQPVINRLSARLMVRASTSPSTANSSMTSRAFWQLVDRLEIPDAEALDLIGRPGAIAASGRRQHFRLSQSQTWLACCLQDIEAALLAFGEGPTWLRRRNRAAPFSDRTPLEWMIKRGEDGVVDVLQFLARSLLRRSLQ